MRLGDIEIRHIHSGNFYLDGGAMFGVVPKPLWEKKSPPDSRNRIRLAANSRPLSHSPPPSARVDHGLRPLPFADARNQAKMDAHHRRGRLDRRFRPRPDVPAATLCERENKVAFEPVDLNR